MYLNLKYKDTTFEIEYNYYPEEPETLDHPKLEEEVEIERIWWLGNRAELINIYRLIESLGLMEDISYLTLQKHKEILES